MNLVFFSGDLKPSDNNLNDKNVSTELLNGKLVLKNLYENNRPFER